MDDKTHVAMINSSASVSPYLLRPLRSHDQALADIAAAGRRASTVTAFVPLSLVNRASGARKTNIAA